MFSNDQKIDAANDLLREAKQYADLRLQRLKLDFVSKLTLLLSALVVSIVLLVIFAVVFLFVAYTLALALAPHVGGLDWACAIIAAGGIVLGMLFYAFRRPLIVQPLTNFVARLFLEKDTEDDDDNEEED